MATTLDNPRGTLVCPKVLSPQATTVPSERNATLWMYPAAMATTLDRPGGGVVRPKLLSPQPTTVQSDSSAGLGLRPAAIALAAAVGETEFKAMTMMPPSPAPTMMEPPPSGG